MANKKQNPEIIRAEKHGKKEKLGWLALTYFILKV
jgi:hypothetical protein